MKSNLSCYILFTEGCTEESVQKASQFLQDNNVSLSFLQLYVNTTVDTPTKVCRPESANILLMGDVIHSALPDGLLLAGGNTCGHQLLVDPRVHHFIRQMRMATRPVGFLYPVYTPLVEVLSQQALYKPFMFQERQYTEQFLEEFMQHMASPKKRSYRQLLNAFV